MSPDFISDFRFQISDFRFQISDLLFTLTPFIYTAVSKGLTGLVPNTTYHYRAVGVNAGGTTNGADMTFTTGLAVPTVTTNAASAVGTTTATLNGTVNANNAATTVTFEYGLTAAYGTTVTADQSPVTGTSNTAVKQLRGHLYL